jgi:thiazole synthase
MNNDPLVIAGKEFAPLIAGTGKYRSMDEMRDAIDASGVEMVTVAIRRLPLDKPDEPNLMDYLDWDRYRSCRTRPAARRPKRRCSQPAWRAS